MIGDKIYIYVEGEIIGARSGPGATALDRWVEVPAVGDVIDLAAVHYVVVRRIWASSEGGAVDLVCVPYEENVHA